MAQTARNSVVLFIAWLWFVATCLASKRPSASVEFTPGRQTQHRHHRSSPYSTTEMAYGPLVRRMYDARNQSEVLGRAEPGEPGMDTYGPLIHVPGCFYCPSPDVLQLKGRDLLESLSTAKMQTYMRINSKKDLFNKCVFYTPAIRRPPQYLSDKAAIWACAHKKLSIWHLWPNKVMASDPGGNFRDFYGIEEPTNWLHSIVGLPLTHADKDVPTMIQYFENTSEAMAKSCSGEVVIMSQTPETMVRYRFFPNIWWNKERPALQTLNKQGKISRFLVVDYDDPTKIWTFNIETNAAEKRVDESTLLSRDLHANETAAGRLLQRVACDSSGLAQMPSQGDPFADDYALFA